MNMKIIQALSLSALALLLSACAGLPKDLPAPHALLDASSSAVTAASTAEAAPWPQANAWDDWADPVLTALIQTALAQQPSLRQVQARVLQAQAAADASAAARGPQVNAAVDLSDQRFTKNGLVPPPLAGNVVWNNSAQLGASWEWDLFGRQQAAVAASVGSLRAASAEAQAARVLLSAQVAAAYVSLARAVENHQISAATLGQRKEVFAIVRQRTAAGLDSTVELRQGEGSIAQAQVEIEAAMEQMARARHALAELSGQRADALNALTPTLSAVRDVPLPQALPLDLLGRRADLVAQRWRVEAATQDVAVARAQFYPNINLVAFAGLSSLGLDSLLRAGSVTYGVGPALRLPVFDGGRLRANLRTRAAEVDVAVEGYNAALLRALREVADEVSSVQSLQRQQLSQTQALQAAEAAFGVAKQRYQAGLGNFLVVLTAEANVLAQRRGTLDLKARHLNAEVALSRALGGAWQDLDASPASSLSAAIGSASPHTATLKATP
jgi:NodT family efflux transporter outer membrane factor (OMF) lipoprotein